MPNITPNVVVSMPAQLFTLRRKFQACANGKIYIGKIDRDPTIPENQIQVYLENEEGSTIPVAQPIIINQSGFPVYNGQIAKFVTVEGHSMAVYDAYGAQQFYFPNILKYNPDRFKEQAEKYIEKLKGTIKQTTGDSTTEVISQKACTDTFAKKNSWEKLTAGDINIRNNRDSDYPRLTLIKSDGNQLLLATSPNDAYFVYRDGKNDNKAVVTIPSAKNGTLAIQEDNYTKTEVDAKINSAKWTSNKSANGWLKDPNTGLIIQWGYRSKENKEGDSYTINFPTAFSSAVYSITTSSKAHNTSSNTMFIGIAYDVTKKGFNYYIRNISGGGDKCMDGYYWMAIGV